MSWQMGVAGGGALEQSHGVPGTPRGVAHLKVALTRMASGSAEMMSLSSATPVPLWAGEFPSGNDGEGEWAVPEQQNGRLGPPAFWPECRWLLHHRHLVGV